MRYIERTQRQKRKKYAQESEIKAFRKEIITKLDEVDTRLEVLNSQILDAVTQMEKVYIDKKQPLSQIKNFLQSMKIKTDKQRQKKEENTH